jgi:hypothetical protein
MSVQRPEHILHVITSVFVMTDFRRATFVKLVIL